MAKMRVANVGGALMRLVGKLGLAASIATLLMSPCAMAAPAAPKAPAGKAPIAKKPPPTAKAPPVGKAAPKKPEPPAKKAELPADVQKKARARMKALDYEAALPLL